MTKILDNNRECNKSRDSTQDHKEFRSLLDRQEIKTASPDSDKFWYEMYRNYSKAEKLLFPNKDELSKEWDAVQWLLNKCKMHFTEIPSEVTLEDFDEHTDKENILVRALVLFEDDLGYDEVRKRDPEKVIDLQKEKTRRGIASTHSSINLLLDGSKE